MPKSKMKQEVKSPSSPDKKAKTRGSPSTSTVANDKTRTASRGFEGTGEKAKSRISADASLSKVNELISDDWKIIVTMVVEGSGDYIRYTRLLQEAIFAGRRRCVVSITHEDIIAAVKQSRNREIKHAPHAAKKASNSSMNATPKDESMKSVLDELGASRVDASRTSMSLRNISPTEEASAMLRAGLELPASLLAHLVRAELLRFRQIEMRRRHSDIESKKKTDAASDIMYSEKPILNTLINGEKQRTRLRKRGCLVSKLDAVEDQPVEGPDLYVVLIGFHSPQLPVELLRAGVPLRGVVLLAGENDREDAAETAATRLGDVRTLGRSWMYVNQAEHMAVAKAQREAVDAAGRASLNGRKNGNWVADDIDTIPRSSFIPQSVITIQNFWPEFDEMLWNPVYFDELKDVALACINIPQLIGDLPEKVIRNFLYDEIANAVYDIGTAERQLKLYNERMMTASLALPMHVPRLAEHTRGATLYASVIKTLPIESCDITFRVRAMLQQVEFWLSEKNVRESDVTGRSPSLADLALVDVVKTDLEMLFEAVMRQYGQPALSRGKVKFPDPLVVVSGDTVLMQTFHVPYAGSTVASTVEVLGTMRAARIWDELPPPPYLVPDDPFRNFAYMLQERMRIQHGVHCSSASLMLEMVAFFSLPCKMPPTQETPRPSTPPLPQSCTLIKPVSVHHTSTRDNDSQISLGSATDMIAGKGMGLNRDDEQSQKRWADDGATTGGSIRFIYGPEIDGGGSIRRMDGAPEAKEFSSGGSLRRADGARETNEESTPMKREDESNADARHRQEERRGSTTRPGGSIRMSIADYQDWDPRDVFVWKDEIDGEFPGSFPDEWSNMWEKVPRIWDLTSVNDVLRMVEGSLDQTSLDIPMLGTRDFWPQPHHQQSQQQPQLGSQAVDNTSLSNASVSIIQRQLSASLGLEAPDPPGQLFSIEAHRYARELSANIMLQTLLHAQVEHQCFDMEYFRPTDVLLVRAHNPVDNNGLWFWRMTMSLPSSQVGLRDFYDGVRDEVREWLAQEEDRQQRRVLLQRMHEAVLARKLASTKRLTYGKGSRRQMMDAFKLQTPSALSSYTASGIHGPVMSSIQSAALSAAMSTPLADGIDSLIDASQMAFWAEEDFLRPRSIKMQLLLGEPNVQRSQPRLLGESVADTSEDTDNRVSKGPSLKHMKSTLTSGENPIGERKKKSKLGTPKKSRESIQKIKEDEKRTSLDPTSNRSITDKDAEELGESVPQQESDAAAASAAEGAEMAPKGSTVVEGSGVARDPSLPGFDLGPGRAQLLAEKRRFAAADGSAMRVEVRDWLHKDKTITLLASQGGHTLAVHHEVRAATHKRQRRLYNFHLTLANGVVIAFGRTPSSTRYTRSRVPPAPPPTSPANELSSNTWTPSPTSSATSTATAGSSRKRVAKPSEETFAFRLRMSWPCGLLVETVKKGNRPVYIRQSYIRKGPECEDIEEELRRCYASDGTVIKFMNRHKRTCVLNPNGAVHISTAYDPPFDLQQESDNRGSVQASDMPLPQAPPPQSPPQVASPTPSGGARASPAAGGIGTGGGVHGKKSGTAVAKPHTPASSRLRRRSPEQSAVPQPSPPASEKPPSPPPIERRVVEMETVQPDGQRWEVKLGDGEAPATWTPTGIYIVRTHTDFAVQETLKRRGDGMVALFKPNGDLSVSFPDGTQISSRFPYREGDTMRPSMMSAAVSSTVFESLGALSSANSSAVQHSISSRLKGSASAPTSAGASASASATATAAKLTGREPKRGKTNFEVRGSPVSSPAVSSAGERPTGASTYNLQEIPSRPNPLPRPTTRVSPALQIYQLLQNMRADRLAGGGEPRRGRKKRLSQTSEMLEVIAEEKAAEQSAWEAAVHAAETEAKAAIFAASQDPPGVFDEFEVINLTYCIEHRNYAKVEADEATGMLEIKIPDAVVRVFPDGTYHVKTSGGPHEMGDTCVTLDVAAEDLNFERRLKDTQELLCRTVVDMTYLADPPHEVFDQVLSRTTDSVGRSFEVLYSGDSTFRQRGPGQHLVHSDNARYFLVHRDLTGLELFTAEALRSLIALTEADRRATYMSQVVVKRPDLSYHVSLLPLHTESERWVMAPAPVRLSSEENRRRGRMVMTGHGQQVRPLRSTYGVPPSWFHPFPRTDNGMRQWKTSRGGRGGLSLSANDDSDEDGENAEAHPGMVVPDPLLVDLLKEMVPYRMRLRRVVRSAVEAIALGGFESQDTFRIRVPTDTETILSDVESRRLRLSERKSTVRPEWQEKTTSTAALNLYRIATQRRTSISMSVSEENLFQRATVLVGAKRGQAAAKRDREQQAVEEMRAQLRKGKGPPYFETAEGKKFLEHEAAAELAAQKMAARAVQMSKTLVEEAYHRISLSGSLGEPPTPEERGAKRTLSNPPPTPPPTPPHGLIMTPLPELLPTSPSPPPPPPPPPSPYIAISSTSLASSDRTREIIEEVCKICGLKCPHTHRECRGDTNLSGPRGSDLSTYFPQHKPA